MVILIENASQRITPFPGRYQASLNNRNPISVEDDLCSTKGDTIASEPVDSYTILRTRTISSNVTG